MDHYTTTEQGSPEALGSGLGAPRRTRKSAPQYLALLDNPHTRRLIAGQLGIRAEQLRDTASYEKAATAEQQANGDIAELIDDLIDALRAV